MELPTVFADRYERGEEIASRSSSIVYKCIDRQSNASCAIKVFTDSISGNQSYLEDCKAEVALLKGLSHNNITNIIDGGVEDKHCYIVMEYVEGQTLRELLKAHDGAPRIEQGLMLAEQISAALEAFRQAGIVHGHLDSRAVLVQGDTVKLCGFFPPVIARIRREMTSADGFIVDPAYISPEQVTGASEPDYRSDMYSLGVLLFEMLTGKKPFVSGNAFQAAMMRVAEEPPSPSSLNSEINPILDAAVVKAMSKTPDSRFQTFADFIDATQSGKGGDAKQASQDTSQTQGFESPSGRIGSETVGVGISTDEIRQMLEQRDQTLGAATTAASGGRSDSNAMPKAATVGPDQDAKLSSPDGAETMVGGIDVSELPASLMVIEGPKRGQRFMFESGQSLLGSDDSCTVAINEKGIPSRYALVVKKGEDYVLAPVSSTGVVVNGQEIESDSDYTLVRGDVIEMGPCRMRYVAPGEVFTLQGDVADRVVDRASSKIPGAVKLITGLVAVVCIGLFFVFQQGISTRDAAMKKAAKSSAAGKHEIIAKLRQEGDALYKEGKLIEPVGANARTRFEQILEIDTEDTYAKRRLDEIKSRVASLRQQKRNKSRQKKKIDQLLTQAKQFFTRGDFVSPPGANAKDTYKSVLRIDSKNEMALAGLEEIDKRLGSLLGQVNSLLAKAEAYRKKGQVVSPSGANAHEMVKKVLALNPGNSDAKELLLDMAAECIYRGDLYKKKARPSVMKKEYLKAQMLGADPEYLAPRMRGAELMKKSSSSVIIFDAGKEGSNIPKETGKGYLSSAEIDRRVASWRLKDQMSGGKEGDRFIQLR